MLWNIWGVFPLVPSKWEKNILVLLSLYISWASVFTFQFFNDKIHNYVFLLHNCEFYHSDIESKHTFLKKYTNLAKLIYFSLILREREEKNPYISHLWCWSILAIRDLCTSAPCKEMSWQFYEHWTNQNLEVFVKAHRG